MKSYITKPEKWYKIVNDKQLREWIESVSHFGIVDNNVFSLVLKNDDNVHVVFKRNKTDEFSKGMVLQDSEVFVYQFENDNVINEKVITLSEFFNEYTNIDSVT